MRFIRVRADKLILDWRVDRAERMEVYSGRGWRECVCRPYWTRSGLWYPVYRKKTGFLLVLGHIGLDRLPEMSAEMRKREVMMVIQRCAGELAPAVRGARFRDGKLGEVAPLVEEYLTAVCFGDGEIRQGASLTIFADTDGIKVLLNERDQDLQLWAVAESFFDLPEALEALLCSDKVPWRRPKGWKPAAAAAGAVTPLPRRPRSRK